MNGRSLSEEAKTLLAQALREAPRTRGMGTALQELIPEKYCNDDYVFEIRGGISKPPKFD